MSRIIIESVSERRAYCLMTEIIRQRTYIRRCWNWWPQATTDRAPLSGVHSTVRPRSWWSSADGHVQRIKWTERFRRADCSSVCTRVWSHLLQHASLPHRTCFSYVSLFPSVSAVTHGNRQMIYTVVVPLMNVWIVTFVALVACFRSWSMTVVLNSPLVRRQFTAVHTLAHNYLEDKNLAIANRSRVSCSHNTPRASIITPWPWNLGSIGVTQGHWQRNYWIDHIRLTISRVIWRWILSWP